MAFNQVGDFWLAPGEAIRVHIARGKLVPDEEWGGEDFGAQWIMADGVGINPVRLMVSEHTKEKKALRRRPGPSGPVVYSVTVTNIGEELAHFTVQGGGNV